MSVVTIEPLKEGVFTHNQQKHHGWVKLNIWAARDDGKNVLLYGSLEFACSSFSERAVISWSPET